MEEIKVYNTLTKEKEVFKPITPGEVKIYVCGVTPYNHPHIGNARPAVTWDIIRRYLEYIGYKVKFVQNFTDVDDKIINKANAEGTDWKTISDRYIDAYFKVMDALHVRRTDVYPRVSDHMDDIIHMVEELIKNGHAYVLGGDVYYDISTFKDYGKLSGRKVEDMLAGARIEVNDEKRNPGDFALWKAAKPGEPFWESPWGKGRPGWHIECSAMSTHYLGNTIDFHGGGSDLIFPHHENEIAQSEGATGHPFARYWIHNGFLTINQEKMSKSLGNYFSLSDLLKKYEGRMLRLYLLTTHYRSPLDFMEKGLKDAQEALARIDNCIGRYMYNAKKQHIQLPQEITAIPLDPAIESMMDDDFNTPQVLAYIFTFIAELNRAIEKAQLSSDTTALYTKIMSACSLLGIQIRPSCPEEILIEVAYSPEHKEKANRLLSTGPLSDADISFLLGLRTAARKARDFTYADELRIGLQKCGIDIRDQKGTSTWIRL